MEEQINSENQIISNVTEPVRKRNNVADVFSIILFFLGIANAGMSLIHPVLTVVLVFFIVGCIVGAAICLTKLNNKKGLAIAAIVINSLALCISVFYIFIGIQLIIAFFDPSIPF